MTREEKIELLQDQIEHGRISSAELGAECEKWDIELHEEVLEPIGWNTCDRCGECGDSELDFLWWDNYDFWEQSKDDKAIIKAVEIEGVDYCALCWDCVKELKEKGLNLEQMKKDNENRLDYLLRKEQVCELDKEERYELQELKNEH